MACSACLVIIRFRTPLIEDYTELNANLLYKGHVITKGTLCLFLKEMRSKGQLNKVSKNTKI